MGVHEQRGANRGNVRWWAASSGEVRSVRGAIFFWLLFFWANKEKVTYEILAVIDVSTIRSAIDLLRNE